MKRIILLLIGALSLSAAMASCTKKKNPADMEQTDKKKTLVAYFSATGTTERVAKMIAKATDGELLRITPEKEYSPADLDWTNKSSRCCRENDDPASRPAMRKTKANLDAYDVVYLGFPNWWNGAPRIINTFIETYGLKNKTVILFMTSGGSGIDNSVRTLRRQYPLVNWKGGKLLNRASQTEINNWVK